MSVIIHWFRRDLRVEDNTSLLRAARDADGVLPLFVLDDHYAQDPNVGPARLRFLHESLEDLSRSLAALGSKLVVRSGPASIALPALVAEVGASAVYANLEIGPYPERRDGEARAALEAIGAKLVLFPDALLKSTNDAGVMTRPIWALMTRLPLYTNALRGPLDNAEWLEARVVNLPSSVLPAGA